MADYTLDGDADDLIIGTSGPDKLTGVVGGNDYVDLGGGDDLVRVDQLLYLERFGEDGYSPPFMGFLSGGPGRDTLDVGMRTVPYMQSDLSIFERPFTLRHADVRDFEILRLRTNIELSVEQFNDFESIKGAAAESNQLEFHFYGEGGTIDLGKVDSSASYLLVFGSGLTSGLTVLGSGKSDLVFDTAHDDVFMGGSGDDWFVHSSGSDVIVGGDGVDGVEFVWDSTEPLYLAEIEAGAPLPDGTMFAEIEEFNVEGGAGGNTLYGRDVADSLSGGGGDDRLHGNGGSDFLRGDAGDDVLYGGDGADTLTGGAGLDVLHGDVGDDRLNADHDDDAFGGEGNDHISASAHGSGFGTAALHGGEGDDTIETGSHYVAYGDGGNDLMLSTGTGDVRYFGGDGRDRLYAASGNDRLDGGRDADTMRGKAGNDTYVVDNTGDTVIELANQGTDTVEVRFGFILPEHVENLVQTGTADAKGWGNAEDNVLTGNAGNNRLNGLAGTDTMIGGLGEDTYIVDNPGDTVVELAGEGYDIVQSNGSVYLSAHVERLELLGTANANGVGTDSANYLTGNDGNNILTGKGGLDALEGGGGADTFRYLALSDSSAATGMDRIVDFDFAEGDRVNVSPIDADAGLAGKQAFDTPIGADAAFTDAGQFRFSKSGNYFLAEFNVNGDPTAELAIRFQGIEPPEETWFIL